VVRRVSVAGATVAGDCVPFVGNRSRRRKRKKMNSQGKKGKTKNQQGQFGKEIFLFKLNSACREG